MNTIRLLSSCVTITAMASTVSAAGICIQGNGGCKDLITNQVYVRSGDRLMDSDTQRPVMTIEPFKWHVVTEQDRLDTSRRKVEAIAQAKAEAVRERIEAANQRVWAYQAQQAHAQRSAQMEYQSQPGVYRNSLQAGVNPSYFGTNGQYYRGVAGGIVNTTNGAFSQDVGAGFVNSQNGQFTPKP